MSPKRNSFCWRKSKDKQDRWLVLVQMGEKTEEGKGQIRKELTDCQEQKAWEILEGEKTEQFNN